MKSEPEIIRSLFEELMGARLRPFPRYRERLDAPFESSVYVIYSDKGKVLYVGRTPRGLLFSRLTNHLNDQSTFTNNYLGGVGSKLRLGYGFRCIVVKRPRRRALLEAYTTGCLCPAHLGVGETVIISPS
jgi:hypothetical protein